MAIVKKASQLFYKTSFGLMSVETSVFRLLLTCWISRAAYNLTMMVCM